MQKKKVNMIVLVVSVILMLIGLSYGYFFIRKNQKNNNVAGSECFKLEFSNESEAINLSNMYPISDEEGKKQVPYSFTITNTCDMLAGYTVNMEMLEGTTLNSKYLDVLVNNEEIKLLSTYEATDTVIANSTESRILTKGTLAYNDSVDYTVRFWMDKDVEDIESMNKLFKSKIVISATPSSWNPKDAGYDTIHDAILANEYQTTPEDAIKKIEAKGEPDLSQTAPVIKWVEKTGSTTTRSVVKPTADAISSIPELSNLSQDEQYMYICTTKSFNSDTSRYSLSDCSLKNPTTLDYSRETKYYYSVEYMSYNHQDQKIYSARNHGNTEVFQIVGATKSISTQTTNGVRYAVNVYSLSCVTLTGMELEIDKSDKGLYQGTDDYGTTYYYRGNVKNNNVYFAGFYWQIVRINGDGSIRLIYDGTEKNATGNNQILDNVKFNNLSKSPAYAGYMFGDPFGTTYDSVHNNTNSSTIKEYIDFWYKNNFDNTDYKNYLSLSTGFCGDRTFSKGDGISSDKYTYFKAYSRATLNTADFVCSNENNDLYTVKSSSIGNKSLTYPIGLITFDELIYSGLSANSYNTHAWSYSTSKYWTMTPSFYSISGNKIFSMHPYGFVYLSSAGDSSFGIRPVINLKSDVKITGGIGTSNDPYVIDTNN